MHEGSLQAVLVLGARCLGVMADSQLPTDFSILVNAKVRILGLSFAQVSSSYVADTY